MSNTICISLEAICYLESDGDETRVYVHTIRPAQKPVVDGRMHIRSAR